MTFRGRLDSLVRRLRAVVPPGDAASDASLLERFIASRDEAAFEVLLWRHGPMVLGVCRRMLRCAQDAEDAFQAAFLLLARKAASIRRREAVAGWLYQTACRVALRARQAARRHPVTVPPGAEPTAADAEPDMVWRDLRPVLDEEIRLLPEKYRLPIILCYFQGQTHAEAAQALGCPRGTVGVRLQRARELLRGRLARRGLALSAAALAVLTVRTASAAIPAALVHGTLKAALLFAAGKAVAAVASAQAAAWTQGVLKTMFLSKLKVLAAVALLVAAVGTGAGLLASHAAAPASAASQPSASARPADDRGLADVPAEEEGRLVLVGTEIKDGETVPPKDRVKAPVGFLAVELGDRSDPKFKDAAAEKWWANLDPAGTKVYARWKDGDALPPGKLFVVREEREYRKLHVGDAVEEGQLLAIVNEDTALHDLAAKTARSETAESEYRAAGTTKQEAERRSHETQRLFDLHTGVCTQDACQADMLNALRFAEEEKGKASSRNGAVEEVRASLTLLKRHEIRSSDRGVVKEILKRRGEAIHNLEAVVRLEVQDAAAPADKPTDKSAGGHANSFISVPAQRDGVLLVVGREIKEGEKVVADRVVVVKVGGEEKRYLRLREGDVVEEGQLLARLDDRLARLDADVQRSKVDAAKAALGTASKVHEAAVQRRKSLSDLQGRGGVAQEEVRAAELDLDRAEGDEQGKAAALHEALTQLKAAEAVLDLYEVRSPVRGVVRTITHNRGEAVRALETVVEIEERVK